MVNRTKQFHRVISLLLLVALIVLGFVASPVKRPSRKNYKVELFPGILYSREVRSTPRPLMIHTVTVDLSLPGIDFLVTPGDEGNSSDFAARTTSTFLQEFGVQIAINGSFFEPFRERTPWNFYPRSGDFVSVQGLTVSNGKIYSENVADYPALCLARNRASITRSGCFEDTTQALSGNHILVENGAVVIQDRAPKTQPRTAVAVDKQGQTLWLIVIDGRQRWYSEGVTLPELAEIILELGADMGLNLDGGGSSTLVAAKDDGPEVLNAPIHTRIPMRQRPVANHLGIYVRPPESNR